MKRRLFHMTSLIILYLLLTAKNCVNQEHDCVVPGKPELTLMCDSLMSLPAPDSLSNASIRAFEIAAKNKLSDFNDYLAIFHDSSVGWIFREKAEEMMRQLFISEKSEFHLVSHDMTIQRNVSLKQLLTPADNASKLLGEIMTDSIRVGTPLVQFHHSVYIGKLSFLFLPAWPKTGNSTDMVPSHGTVDFLALKHARKFGKNSLLIWDLFLGNMEDIGTPP